jgi:hypothetical protein
MQTLNYAAFVCCWVVVVEGPRNGRRPESTFSGGIRDGATDEKHVGSSEGGGGHTMRVGRAREESVS